MINAWEHLESEISRDPVVVSLDDKMLDAMAKMRGESDLLEPSGEESSWGGSASWDGASQDDVAISESISGSGYVVIVEHDQVVGLLTEQDIGRLALQQAPFEQLTLRQVLRRPPVTIREAALSDFDAVINLFQQNQLSHLPVIDDAHQLVGVISSASLYRVLHFTLMAHLTTANTDTAPQASQKQFQHLAENMPGMVYRLVRHLDGDYELTYVNSRAEEMFEVDSKKMLQNINYFWERIHPDDLDWLHTEIQVSAKTLQSFNSEFRLQLPTQGLRWVKMIAHPEQLADGDVIWDGIVLDIAARKHAQADLKRTSQDLDRATQLKDEFLASMSYELRTPLNAILGMTEGLQDGIFGQLNAQQLKTLQSIEQSGSYQLELINEILDFAKIESGTLELAYSAVSVTHLCQSTLAAVKQQSLEKGIQLYLNIPWSLPDIRVDERRIHQVLVYLLSNAVKFVSSGGSVTLEVALSPSDDNQIQHCLRFVVVTDSEVSIGAESMKPLSSNFVELDEGTLNQLNKGTGLGLALVKRVVELHGGQVAVPLDTSVGYCFAIDLPYDIAAQKSQGTPAVEDADVPLSKTFQPDDAPLILLAEDNEANIIAPSSYLQSKGYRIQIAKNGQSAIELAQSEMPHVILMDIQMPDMDGLTAIQHIREIPSLAKIPIIALTAFAMDGDQERCLAAGANKYLSKPVKLKQLVLSIQELIAQ